jgi:hypothetical protein
MHCPVPASRVTKKRSERLRRNHKFRMLAHGYKVLKSPLAASFARAAAHYDGADAPHDVAGSSQVDNDLPSLALIDRPKLREG